MRLRSLSFVLSTLGHYEVTTTVMTGIFLRMLKDGMQNVVVEAIGQDTKKKKLIAQLLLSG